MVGVGTAVGLTRVVVAAVVVVDGSSTVDDNVVDGCVYGTMKAVNVTIYVSLFFVSTYRVNSTVPSGCEAGTVPPI